jgi:hypothetical protein
MIERCGVWEAIEAKRPKEPANPGGLLVAPRIAGTGPGVLLSWYAYAFRNRGIESSVTLPSGPCGKADTLVEHGQAQTVVPLALPVFCNFANDTTGISGREHPVWHISSNDAASTNDRL